MGSGIQAALDEAAAWLDYDGVEGVAEGERNGAPCILVLTSCDPAELTEKIPKKFKGFPVVFEQTGSFAAY